MRTMGPKSAVGVLIARDANDGAKAVAREGAILADAAGHRAHAALEVEHRAADVVAAARLVAALDAGAFAHTLPVAQAALAAARGVRAKAAGRDRPALAAAGAGVGGVGAIGHALGV